MSQSETASANQAVTKTEASFSLEDIEASFDYRVQVLGDDGQVLTALPSDNLESDENYLLNSGEVINERMNLSACQGTLIRACGGLVRTRSQQSGREREVTEALGTRHTGKNKVLGAQIGLDF